jgi:hypothetical protein
MLAPRACPFKPIYSVTIGLGKDVLQGECPNCGKFFGEILSRVETYVYCYYIYDYSGEILAPLIVWGPPEDARLGRLLSGTCLNQIRVPSKLRRTRQIFSNSHADW